MSRYGELLKTLIKFTDIKMSTVADNLGYDVSYISKWCNKSKLPAGRVSNEVNRNLAKLFSDEIINQNELSSFCSEFSVVISEDKLENYLYNALKDAFKKSEGESEAPGRKTTYNTRTLVYQRELSDFFDKELFNILYSSAEPVEMLCTFNIFDYINTSELSDNPIVNSPIHVKLGIATENVSKMDFFSLYNLINKYHYISFDFYDNSGFGNQNLIVIKDKIAVICPTDGHGNISVAVIINDPEKVQTIYERTKALFRINHMLIIATTAKEMMQTGYRSSFYAYGDFQMFMARGFEFLVPPELIDSIVKSAYEQGFDESTEKFLRKLIVTWDDIFSKEKADFFILKSTILKYIDDGELYFTDILHRMSVSEREAHIKHVLEMCKKNHNLNFYVIDDENINYPQQNYYFAMFNNHKKLFLKNTKHFYTKMGPQFYSILNESLINNITDAVASIKDLPICTHYPAEALQSFMDRYGGMVYKMLSLNELNDLCK